MGFVLIEVAGKKVNSSNWFEAFQNKDLPFSLTFHTNMPVHENNTFFKAFNESQQIRPLLHSDFEDFKCEVTSNPFGMQVRAPVSGRPTVVRVLKDGVAESQGVREGDILV